MSRSQQLGKGGGVAVSGGKGRYRERGGGPPGGFLHGVLGNGDLLRDLVPRVADAGFRCITPDLPIGGHELPMDESADLTPPGLARLIVEMIDALGLDRPIVVANDTGGALTQIAMAEHGDKLGPVVLTSCDAFEDFFPPLFRYLTLTARIETIESRRAFGPEAQPQRLAELVVGFARQPARQPSGQPA